MPEAAVEGHTVQGLPVAELAERYGTPLYLYDGEVIRETYRQLRDLLDPSVEIYYSLKANPNISVCALLHSLGAGAEVSSLAELVTARRAGVPARDIIFLGPGKSAAELAACVEQRIGAIVCESLEEVSTIDAMAAALPDAPGEPVRVMLRVNPSFATKGSRLAMGGKPRQFGIDQEHVAEAGSTLRALRHVRVIGLHAYMGTRILDAADIAHNTRSVLTAAAELATALDLPLDVVDVGGGFGVPYFDNESPWTLRRWPRVSTAPWRDSATNTPTPGSSPNWAAIWSAGRGLTWSGHATSRRRAASGSSSPTAAPTTTWRRWASAASSSGTSPSGR
ncbi:hypothetical protein GCM10029963_24070 [Micromonospora andamanensis]